MRRTFKVLKVKQKPKSKDNKNKYSKNNTVALLDNNNGESGPELPLKREVEGLLCLRGSVCCGSESHLEEGVPGKLVGHY